MGVNQKGLYSGVRMYRRIGRGKVQGEVSERSGLLHWPAEKPGGSVWKEVGESEWPLLR